MPPRRRDPLVESQIEAIIDDLEKPQAPDGCPNCRYLEREPQNRWTDLRDILELPNAGHMLQGAVAMVFWAARMRNLDPASQ